MPPSPWETFENGMQRAVYLMQLYDLLHNRRQRGIRSDWADSFKRLMHWNRSDALERVDGKQCILILRNPSELTMGDFDHEHLSELLRAALVFAVSALDRYFHDMITWHLLAILRGSADKLPKRLADFPVRLLDAEAAIAHALRSRRQRGTATRPRTILKARFADALHKCTFQSSTEIDEAFAMLGIRKPWGKIAQRMAGNAEDIRSRLDKIIQQRNQIVHEGHVIRSQRPRTIKLHPINPEQTRKDIHWLKKLVQTTNQIVQEEL